MSSPLLVTKRPDGAVDTVYNDGLMTRERDGEIIVVRGIGEVDPGTVYGYASRWLYERLTDQEIEDIINSEFVVQLQTRMASGLSMFAAGLDLMVSLGIDPETVAAREPVREWPPTEFLEE